MHIVTKVSISDEPKIYTLFASLLVVTVWVSSSSYSGGIDNYSIFDCDLNGTAAFAGLIPDRLVILINLGNSTTAVYRQHLP